MAFSFGSSTPAFGAASSGGFSFGGSSTPAFGAPASSTPAFSFGGTSSSAPAFGASSTPSFGAVPSSTPAFGAPAASQPLFGAPAAASTPAFGFGASAPAQSSGFSFGGGALVPAASPAPSASPFGSFGAAPAAAAPVQPSGALTYNSRFDDLPPQVQQAFNQLQQQISQYESDRAAVSQMSHLLEAPDGGRDVGAEAATLQSELASVQGSMRAEEEALANFREKAVLLLKAADAVVRTFQRTKLWRDAPTQFKGQVMPTAMQELLSQPVLLPSPFLEQAVAGFADQVSEFKKTVSELEQVLASQSASQAEAALGASGMDVTMALPTVVSNMHDFFTHVAAKLERVHAELQAAKSAHRAALKQQGVYRDPFERAQQQAERLAKARPHVPSLLPPPSAAGGASGGGATSGAAGGGAYGGQGGQSPGAAGGFGVGGAFGAGFGSPFPGTPGAFGTPPGAAALGRTSSKSNRPNKSRR